jgi:PAS domain-containing protein
VPAGKADGLPARFDPQFIMSDAFFIAHDAVSASAIQSFFEATPYGQRSWLADERIGDHSAAEAFVNAAKVAGVNPIVLLARTQVEMSLISKARPSQRRLDFAFGCGCPDGRACYEQFRGLERQLECAGETLRTLYDGSVSGEGVWRAGKARKTLDPTTITPVNHATAALYGYTPWVLPRRGGNWLVWNITNKFADAFDAFDQLQIGDDACLGDGERPFVGSPCGCAADCGFSHNGQWATCHPTGGFCTLACAGPCPDLSGFAPTFCAADPLASVELPAGMCVPKAHAINGHCADLPGTLDREVERYVGDSGSAVRTADVCLPND